MLMLADCVMLSSEFHVFLRYAVACFVCFFHCLYSPFCNTFCSSVKCVILNKLNSLHYF